MLYKNFKPFKNCLNIYRYTKIKFIILNVQQAALMWSKKCCDTNQNISLKDIIGNFLEYIQFHKIPANVLMREVHPLGLVPYSIIMNALAYQVRTA